MSSASQKWQAGARVPSNLIRDEAGQALVRAGVASEDAGIVSDVLTEADLRGIDSHGIAKVPTYLARIQAGTIQPGVRRPRIASMGAVAHCDGLEGLGPLIAYRAMEDTIHRATVHGVAIAFVHRSNHAGIAGYYAELAARAGGIGLFTTNAGSAVVPWGGRTARLGTNPIAIAIPHSPNPILLDMATSTVAKGKLELAAAAGLDQIPAGWSLDGEGRPTTSLAAALLGSLTPLGGYKGSGLAFMVAALAAIAGASPDFRQPSLSREPGERQDIGHFMMAIANDALPPDYAARVRDLAETIRRDQPGDGFTAILLPGDPEWTMRTGQLANGVVLTPASADALNKVAAFNRA